MNLILFFCILPMQNSSQKEFVCSWEQIWRNLELHYIIIQAHNQLLLMDYKSPWDLKLIIQ